MRILLLMLLSANVSAWGMIYHNDKLGNTVSGSEADLWQAASEAKDIKVEVLWAGVYRMFECSHVHRDAVTDTVVCEAELRVGQITLSGGVPTGGSLMRHGVGLFSSAGYEQWYAVLGDYAKLSKALLEMDIKWFAN